MGTGDIMRLVGLSIILLASSICQVQAGIGYSREFIQCMNTARGEPEKTERCLKSEKKDHAKLLKQNYKKLLKANPERREQLRAEHKVWEDKLEQRCESSKSGKYAKMQVAECELGLTIEQSNRYESRSFVPKNR